MNKKILFFLLPLLAGALSAYGIEEKGYLRLEKRFPILSDSIYFFDFYNQFFLEMSQSSGELLFFKTSFDFRFYTFSGIGKFFDLQEPERNFPFDLFLWEAYIDIRRFPFKSLDMRIGKQRVSWGTAYGFNPTDNLNPDDFSDILRFERKLPTESILASYYSGNFSLSAFWGPGAYPALLPEDISLFSISDFFDGLPVTNIKDTLILPDRALKNGQFALKLNGRLWGYDISLSGFKGFEHLPFPKTVKVTSDPQNPSMFLYELTLCLPEVIVLGADFAGDLLNFGVWGEGAIFFPEKIRTVITTPFGQDSISALAGKPYTKGVLGFDTFFWNGSYINFQIARGFPPEIGEGNIGNYFTVSFEKPFLLDRLVTGFSGIMEIRELQRFEETRGSLLSAEISYIPLKNLKLTLGFLLLDGKEGSIFGKWKDWDIGFIQTEISF